MKKRMYKIMALAMTAAMVVPMAAQTTAFAADDKEITYWNIAVESPDKDIVTAAVDKFNKETESGYTVNQVAIQNDTYKEKLVIAMSSGECPDMYSSWSGGPMYEYIDSGFAQPIDDLLDQSDVKDKLLDAAIEQGSYNGHVYAIPYLNVSLAGIFYNKDMFKQYGLEEPKTLADLENICATLKENGITPFALANASKWTGSMYFMSLAAGEYRRQRMSSPGWAGDTESYTADDPSPFPCCRYRLSSGTDAAAVPQWTLPADGHRHTQSGSAWLLSHPPAPRHWSGQTQRSARNRGRYP